MRTSTASCLLSPEPGQRFFPWAFTCDMMPRSREPLFLNPVSALKSSSHQSSTALPSRMDKHFQIFPVGIIRKKNERVTIEIFEEYADALHGLHQFSHLIVCYWFHENDMVRKRTTLKVHPRGNSANPLTGVFATHSPVRPNLIGLSTCKILSIAETVIHVDNIDALDGTPIIDLKPQIPGSCPEDIRTPGWV